METLFNLLLFAGLMFVMMRFGCGAHMIGHGKKQARGAGAESHGGGCCGGHDHGRTGSDEPPETAVDPVCGKTVDTNRSRPTVYAGRVFHLCSRECREAFETLPASYVENREPPGEDGGPRHA